MKMRKILPLVILAVGALFLLSGCDALLDAIFQNNVIKVDVYVYAPNHIDYPSGYVYVTLYDNNSGASTSTGPVYWTGDYSGSYAVFNTIKFPTLKSDSFTLTAYYYGAVGGTGSTLYDSSFTTPIANPITMPYPNSYDSTGHTIELVMPVS